MESFIKNQIETYDKENNLEFILGEKIDDYIFNNTIFSEELVNNIIKQFRNYKLSYSQGKIYKYLSEELKTFNNKYSEIHKSINLESTMINENDLDILLLNNDIKQLQEFEIRNNYTEEYLYDELNVHLDDNVLLIFRKNENTKDDKNLYSIRFVINLEKNLPLKFQTDYINKINESLKIIITYISLNNS